MTDLRVVHFSEPQAFVDAVTSYDDSFMNYALGSLLDSLDPAHPRAKDRATNYRTLVGVYRDEKLIITLTKIADDFAWILSTPQGADEELPPETISTALEMLVALLHSIIDPKVLDSVIGPADYVNAFIGTWVSYVQARGTNIKALNPFFKAKVSYATLATIPTPSPAFAQYKFTKAQTEEDAELAALLMVDFRSRGPKKSTLEEAKRVTHVAVQMGQLWLCRVDGEIAGYTLVGRVTPRTIAIRNVYIAPTHRRKGIAEAMVRALTRFYLGAEPLGFEGAPSSKPDIGTREEICLNVAEEAVERLYKRCGFLLGEDDHDLVTGKKGWYQSMWQGVEFP